jgi:hypothetical protein
MGSGRHGVRWLFGRRRRFQFVTEQLVSEDHNAKKRCDLHDAKLPPVEAAEPGIMVGRRI